ncbi:MAG: inositol monophosphatase family protein [Bilophila wadsworthia]
MAEGKRAWRNGERISVSSVTACENALIATGFLMKSPAAWMKFWSECVLCCLLARVRRCGAAALDLAWTACGRFDAFYEDELKPWDMAAGALLVTEAGGSISNLDGSPFDLRWSILAGNKAMHELIGKMIR